MKQLENVFFNLEKALRSNKEDVSVLNEIVAVQDTKIKQLEKLNISLKADVEKQNEAFAMSNRIRKRIRKTSYIEIGTGAILATIGYLPIWTNEQKSIQSLFLGSGFTLLSMGSIGFIFTLSW